MHPNSSTLNRWMSLPLGLLLFPGGAAAANFEWVKESVITDDVDVTVTAECPEDTTVVFGGASHTSFEAASHTLTAFRPEGDHGFTATTTYGSTATVNTAKYDAFALCASEDVSACLERVSASSPLDTSSSKTVTAKCPSGTFAVGGGAEIVGNTHGRGFRRLGPSGLFLPLSWTATVDVNDLDYSVGTAWAVDVEVVCAPMSALSEVTLVGQYFQDDALCIGGGCSVPGYAYANDRYWDFGPPSCDTPLSAGMAGDPGRWLHSAYPNGNSGTLQYSVIGGTITEHSDASALTYCVDDYASFADTVADTCGPSGPPTHDFGDWAIGIDIWFGVIGGGGGVGFLPGVGPIPIDPEPFRVMAAALPIAVVGYDGAAELDALLDTVTASLDDERVAWTETDSPADALRTRDVVLLAPRDEADAIAWLSRNRASFDGRGAPVVVLLQEGGAGFDALESW